jgi:Domain of Unknown Function (DUF1080)
MRVLSYALLLVGVGALLIALPCADAGDFKLEPGFTLLFNGKTLDGWRQKSDKAPLEGKTHAYDGRFKVNAGILVYDPAVRGDRYIETTKEFASDVHFKFDFKPGPKCNNDILFRGKKFDIIPGDKETKNVKEGEWHTFELTATGNTLQYKINGEAVRTTSKVKATASTFVLRAELGVIQIKNIRVKE